MYGVGIDYNGKIVLARECAVSIRKDNYHTFSMGWEAIDEKGKVIIDGSSVVDSPFIVRFKTFLELCYYVNNIGNETGERHVKR